MASHFTPNKTRAMLHKDHFKNRLIWQQPLDLEPVELVSRKASLRSFKTPRSCLSKSQGSALRLKEKSLLKSPHTKSAKSQLSTQRLSPLNKVGHF